MRQLNFGQPKQKVRGIKKKLTRLDDWAESFKEYFPVEYSNDPYWNCKLPVLSNLVNPPTARKKTQSACLNSLLKAAFFIHSNRPHRFESFQVVVLIIVPTMFDSEIRVFFDQQYYQSFFQRNSEVEKLQELKGQSLLKKFSVISEYPVSEKGYLYSYTDKVDGKQKEYKQEWWEYKFL